MPCHTLRTVIILFLPPPLVALSFLLLVALGVKLQLIVERFGLLLAVSVHLGADAVASLIVTDVLWEWGLAR